MKECPICRIPLKEVPKYGVNIDVCPTCRGAWLDRGELEKVVSLARDFHGEYEQMSERYHQDTYDLNEHYKRPCEGHIDKHSYKHKKKKKHGVLEILGDLFD